ncbi:glycosyl transferase [Methanocella sp. CWC-04]|uniref:Glycosyl transferase n=1 Tax=Methanooceanicella nereidis TaxID=2052831 RepID=A0AAP2W6R9_9EURY|nr:glycosyltransferase [Methanocella sp. CWC-04]MCD1294554.1 glycosyl transferase [Methanocella sp. CWC-04]
MDISVVIPAYNEEKYIEKCLKSLSRQDFKGNYEIIVSDGSSTDKTVKIARRYADQVIIDAKSTIAYGRQTGSLAAKYSILAYTDADTHIPSDWLSNIAASMSDEKVVGVHGKLLPLDGNRIEEDFCKYIIPPYSKFMVHINKPSVPGSNFAVRKWAFDRVGGFNTKLVTGEDVDICARIKKLGKFVYNPDALVYVSTRRVREWGYLKMISHYTSNTILTHTFGKPRTDYDAIR